MAGAARTGGWQLVEQVATEADASAGQPMPADTVWTKPCKTVTVATRVSPEHLAAIESLAGQLDVPMSALLRGWILAGLNARKDESVQTAIEGLSADVQRLRELVASGTSPRQRRSGDGDS